MGEYALKWPLPNFSADILLNFKYMYNLHFSFNKNTQDLYMLQLKQYIKHLAVSVMAMTIEYNI